MLTFNPSTRLKTGTYPATFLLIIIILFAISNVSFSQGRRDRPGGLNNYNKSNTTDTTGGQLNDSTLQLSIDTTKIIPADSTSRIRYFTYSPQYSYGTKLPKKISPLLLDNASNIKYEVKFDTTGNVIITEKFEGTDIRAPLVLTMDQYLAAVSTNNINSIFTDIVDQKFTGNTQDDLTKLFDKFTDITIPLPFKSESIFGPPSLKLKINGAVDITASYQNSSSDQTIISGLSNSNNSINFKQEVQLTAKGTVGDKLTIDADYNTQRLFDFENQLKIKYEGYPDEVIKKLEGGNVSLETRSGLIGSSQALFGIKGDFQLGALSLSAVVSQKKSKTEVKAYTGGAQEQEYTLKVWDYSDNHYLLDTLYKQSFLNYYNSTTITSQTDSLSVDDQSFEIWVQTDLTNPDYRFAGLHVNLPRLPATGKYPDSLKVVPNPVQGLNAYAIVRKLAQSEYTLNKYAGYVSLKISLPENYVAGVAYKRTKTGEQFGTISTDAGSNPNDTLVLKEIKVENLVPSNTVAWELKLKNIYRLPVSRIVQEGFEFNVQYLTNGVYQPTLPPSEQISTILIGILGLDKYTNGRSGPPDNKFDFIPGVTIDPENGFVIFPSLKPFLNNFKLFPQPIDSSYWYPQIYDQVKTSAYNLPNANNYIISGKARGEASVSNTINLGFNIVQGSVVVKVGEIELGLNSDYTIDYSTGTLVIRNSSALLSKDLKISYETNDLFTLASKTFLGLRGDYKISDKSSLGFTFVNLNQATLNDKVRIGEEPTNNSMYGLDFTTELPSRFLTSLVNMLPGYNTKEPSSLTIRGELAAINPDPNTNKSKIPIDNNEAVAYIDDMEGVKKNISLGGIYNSWTIASPPLDNTIAATDSLKLKNAKRGKMRWYNIANSANLTDIYPLKDVQQSQNSITPFYMTYDPKHRGTYNYNGKFVDTVDKETSWNGVMKYLNTTSNDLINENINFIEFSMRVDNLNDSTKNGKLIIDLGSISQDVILNGDVDTEDSLKNGELRDRSDDLGLDFKTDAQELAIYRQMNNGQDPPNALELRDPALDNNDSNGTFFVQTINGTQNNFNFESGRRPDTEDLNKTDNVRNPNDYFQFEINVNPVNNPYVVGDGKPGTGWHQYKIPLSDYVKAYGNATFTNIRFARMWMTGIKDSLRLTMYDINLTGNQWVKQIKTDTTYNITAVSIEENPQIYSSPVEGDALRQTIRGQNNIDTKSNEQSLSVEVFNLTNGVKKIARKDFSANPLNLFNYRTLKLYVNGDPTFNYTSKFIYDATMVVRIGNDSNNYYEYRAPIHPDARIVIPFQQWDSSNNVTINFADLTKLKLQRDSANVPYTTDTTNGPPGSSYKVFGNPDLQSIREIILGVEKNRNSVNSSISGSVWFNELRVINVVDDPGLAYNVSANIKLADLLDFNFALSNVNPYFHAIDTRIGTLTNSLSWNFSTTLNLHKFINNAFSSFFSEDWNNFITLPITFTHTESMVNPNYFPGTDIVLNDAADVAYNKTLQLSGGNADLATIARNNVFTEAQSLVIRNGISISNLSFNLPSSNYLVKNIFNQLRFNFNSDFGNSRDITYESKSDFRYTGGLSFGTDFGLSDKLSLNIGNIIHLGEKYNNAKIYLFFPFIPLTPLFSNNFSAATDFNRSESQSKQRKFFNSDLTTRDFKANRGFRFDWKFIENWIVDINGNYDFRVGSDLTPYETINDSITRSESEIFNDIFFNKGIVNFGKDLDYVQSVTINPRLNIPFIDRFLAINGNYNVRYGWINPNITTNVGYNLGYQNQISSSATFKLKEVFSLFQGSGDSKLQANGIARDTLKQEPGNKQSLADIFKLFATFVPGDIAISFTQSNQVSNGGVTGKPGFGNFWLYPTTQADLGPSRSYQMGFSLYPGTRAPNLNQIADAYTQGDELSFTTTINPIIPEAITMSLKFTSSWSFSNNLIYASDALGNIGNPTSKTSTITNGNTMLFAGSVENFSYEYDNNNPTANRSNLTSSFKQKIAAIPFPNWSMTISGLEKFPFFSQFANSVTLDNSFVSEYKESKLIDINSYDIPNAQSVTQAFAPLLGLNFNFKEVLGGNLVSTFRLNTGKIYLLNPIGASIQATTTNEWSINANFSKAGFNIPLFGLALQNDISFALTLSKITNEPVNYDYGTSGAGRPIPGNGSAVTSINPSIQYSLSSKVSMQLFYKYIKTAPTAQSSVTTVPRTSNEGGLNIRITIQ